MSDIDPTATSSPAGAGGESSSRVSPLMLSLKTILHQPAFLLAAGVLLVAALTLNGATEMLKLHFRKEPVALRHPLEEIPAQLGPWLQVSKDEPLDKEMEDMLGTEKYVFRTYVDTRQINTEELSRLKNEIASGDTREHVARIESEKPGSVLSADVTYYTGLVDTVPHIPDRCMVAGGFEPIDHAYPTFDVSPPAVLGAYANAPARELKVCFINFEDQTADLSKLPVNVAYFFQCNGSYESDPINGVRMRLQDLTERHGYFAKVELKTVMSDINASKSTMADFLRYALPEIERCLPDWQAVKRAEAQANGGAKASVNSSEAAH